MKKAFAAVAFSSILLSGCVISIDDDMEYDGYESYSSWEERQKENREQISRLKVGSSIASVKGKMGTPDFDELVVKDGKEHRLLYYRTQRAKGDGVTTKDECTPILFVNGELAGFGDSALQVIGLKSV